MKLSFKRNKLSSRLVSALTVVGILLLFGLNLLLTSLGLTHTIFIDTTPEGLYTLTDAMKSQLSYVDTLEDDGRAVRITFCADPDTLLSVDTTRVPYLMSLELADEFDNVEVETVNVTYNPAAVQKYKPTSLSEIEPTDVIVSYGDRYRVVSLERFWVQNTSKVRWAYNGEYRMASIIMSVTSKNRPAAYFVTNHGESYYDAENPSSAMSLDTSYLYDLLGERGLDVKTIDLSREEIPDDCVLLVINNPRTDFVYDPDKIDSLGYVSESEKLDRYLVSRHGSIMVSKDHELSLPTFDAFLHEWGFDIQTGLVKDDENYMPSAGGDHSKILGMYNTDENSYAHAIYGEFADLPSAPAMVFENTGFYKCSYAPATDMGEAGTNIASRNYASLFRTSLSAKSYEQDADGVYNRPSGEGEMHIAGVTTRLEMDSYTAEYKYSYLFCAPSAGFFSSELLGNTSYANYDIVSALVENMSRVDEYASIELGGTSYNSPNLGGKRLLDVSMTEDDVYEYNSKTGREELVVYGLGSGEVTLLTVMVMLVPVGVAIAGIVIRVRRKNL